MRTILVRDEIYERLRKLKRDEESFSDVIEKLLDARKSRTIEVLEEVAESLSESDIEDIVLKERTKFRMRDFVA